MPFVALSTGAKTEQHIRKRFLEWFEQSGQSQREAGQAIEWEQQTVSSYFRGEQQIDFVRAITWCRHFGYTLEDLLAKAPPTKPSDPGLLKWMSEYTGRTPRGRQLLLEFLQEFSRGRKAAR